MGSGQMETNGEVGDIVVVHDVEVDNVSASGDHVIDLGVTIMSHSAIRTTTTTTTTTTLVSVPVPVVALYHLPPPPPPPLSPSVHGRSLIAEQ